MIYASLYDMMKAKYEARVKAIKIAKVYDRLASVRRRFNIGYASHANYSRRSRSYNIMKFTAKDEAKLKTLHPDLVKVVRKAASMTTVPFMIMETTRTVAKQKENIKKGVSWTMKSRHLPSKDGMARAVDIVPIDSKGQVIWAWPIYYKLAPIMKAAAKLVKIPIEWGGDWKKTKDGPHWQLPWKSYP